MTDIMPDSPRLEIPALDVTIDVEHAEDEAHQVRSHVRPGWVREDIKLKRCGVGFTNLVLTAYVGDLTDAVVLRIYMGKFAIICDKVMEKNITKLLHELRLIPEVHCFFNNGFCYEYVQGLNISWLEFSDFEDIKIAKANVRELAKLHCHRTRDLAINKCNISPQNKLADYLERLLTLYPDKIVIDEPGANKLLKTIVPSKDELLVEMSKVWAMAEAMGLDVCLCHIDANPTNFIYDKEADKSTLIDYDLGGFGFAEYDLALFLLMINEGLATSAPDSARRQPEYWKETLRAYLCTRRELDGTRPVTEKDVERIYVKVLKMTLYHSLVIIAIAIMHAGTEKLPFGTPSTFLNFAHEHFYTFYLRRRDELFKMKIPD